tara:strand:- start:1744 stop:2682 length:939 start_codon:yes stop_codon:yes gene_type:complete
MSNKDLHIIVPEPKDDYILFMGCSFTWGQGLWNYDKSNEATPTYDEYIFENIYPTLESDKERIKLRFANIVSTHFGLEHITKESNGGSEEESLRFLNNFTKGVKGHYPYQLSVDKCKLLVFQFSSVVRNYNIFEYKGNVYKLRLNGQWLPDKEDFITMNYDLWLDGVDWDSERDESADIDIFYEYLMSRNLDIHGYFKEHLMFWLGKVEKVCKEIEDMGIPCVFLHWESEYLEYLYAWDWLKERTLPILYKEETFGCIEDAYMKYPELTILGDKEANTYPNDTDAHPSKKCHKVIGDSIIKFIDERKEILLR